MKTRMYIKGYLKSDMKDGFFNNDSLLKVAETVKEGVENCKNVEEAIKKVEKILGKYKFNEGQGYQIDRRGIIILYDKNLYKRDFYGDDVIEIFLCDDNKILLDLEKIVKKIKNADVYEVTSSVHPNGYLAAIFGDYACSDTFGKCLTYRISGKELKKILTKWIKYVKKMDQKDANSVSEGNNWSFMGNENILTIVAEFIEQTGVYYFPFIEAILFEKLSDKVG